MQWQKLLPNQELEDALLLLAMLLLVLGLIIDQPLLFLLTGAMIVYISLIKLYDRKIAKQLKIDNPRQTLRLFTGETIDLKVRLHNYDRIPYTEGILSFEASDHVYNQDYCYSSFSGWHFYRVPMTLAANNELEASIPFEAQRRGLMTIRHIRYTFTHPLTFQSVDLTFKQRFHTRAMIYPDLASVYMSTREPAQYLGDQASQHALFKDMLQPIGTREALLTDSFKHIHWKASAKRQELQTKVYQPNQHIAWTIVVNMAETSRLGNTYVSNQSETYLSQAAFVAKQLISQGEPVELFVNSSVFSGPLHIPEGSDVSHLKKLLEGLALVPLTGIFPMTSILHSIANQRVHSQMLILIGSYNSADRQQIHALLAKGHPVYQVRQSVLHPYSAQGSGAIEA